MRILVVSRWYAPRNIIGAVRPTQLCKYLARNGNEVLCIVEDYLEDEFKDESILPVVVKRVATGRVGAYSLKHSKKSYDTKQNSLNSTVTPSNKSRLVKVIRRHLASIMHIIDEFEWTRNALKVIEDSADLFKPEVIITSYGPESSVLIGRKFKKRHKDILWISDMRDPMTHSQQTLFRKMFNGHLEKQMAKTADAITTVSDSLGDKYRNEFDHSNVGVFVNGFDPEDSCDDLSINDGVLRIGYTGSLYSGKSKMDALFEAIKSIEVSTERHVPIELHYAGGNGREFLELSNKYGVVSYVVNHGLLSKVEAQRLQEKCDILCVLTWNTLNERGVLTGKFPEYLRLKKNILALISGDIPEAELSKRIRDLQCGFSYEYCSDDSCFTKLVDWLLNMIRLKENGSLLFTNDYSEIENYSYQEITTRFDKFLKSIELAKGNQIEE